MRQRVLSRTNNTASTNGTIMLGHMDSFASIGSPLNYTLYDNVRVINLTKTPIRITAITPGGGNLLIDFTADPAALAGAFTLESSTTLLPGSFVPDTGSSVVAMGPAGTFRATSPNAGNIGRFYRIKQ